MVRLFPEDLVCLCHQERPKKEKTHPSKVPKTNKPPEHSKHMVKNFIILFSVNKFIKYRNLKKKKNHIHTVYTLVTSTDCYCYYLLNQYFIQ